MRAALLAVTFVVACGATDGGARAVLDRTKTSTATYASYDWSVSRDEKGAEIGMWVAEFHSGDMYRAESPYVRVVINCRTHEGYSLNLLSGEEQRDDTLYAGDCGISTTGSIESIVRLATVPSSALGLLDVIKVTDATRIRYYQVDKRGVIMRSSWNARNGVAYPCIQAEPIARLATLPSGDIFSKASLTTSVVANRYRHQPRPFPTTALSGKVCGENL